MADNDYDRAAKIEHENKMIRRLRFLVDLTFATIAQDNDLTLEQGWEHVLALKGAAVAMFPARKIPSTSSICRASRVCSQSGSARIDPEQDVAVGNPLASRSPLPVRRALHNSPASLFPLPARERMKVRVLIQRAILRAIQDSASALDACRAHVDESARR